MKHARIINLWCDACCNSASTCTCEKDNRNWKEIRKVIEVEEIQGTQEEVKEEKNVEQN